MRDDPAGKPYWSVLVDGNGQMFVRNYDASLDEFKMHPVADRVVAEAYIRANSARLVARYNSYGERLADEETSDDLWALLSIRASNAMKNERIESFAQLEARLAADAGFLRRVPNVGPVVAAELINMLTMWKRGQ